MDFQIKNMKQWIVGGRPYGLALLATLGVMGCAENDLSFYIRNASVPEKGCVISDDFTGGSGLSKGRLDVSMKLGYLIFPQLENRLMSTTTSNDSVERNNLHLREFRVSIDLKEIPGTFPAGMLDFSVLTSGMIAPGGSFKTGFKVIPDALANLLQPVIPKTYQPVIVATITAVAERSSEEVESAEFLFPIELCNGCLVDWTNENCTVPPETGEEDKFRRNTCGLPQDMPVTCCNTTRGLECLMAEET